MRGISLCLLGASVLGCSLGRDAALPFTGNVLLPSAPPAPPPPADTPIKIGGGAMTFHSKSDWQQVPNTPQPTFCTTIRNQTSYAIQVEDPALGPPVTLPTNWSLEVRNYSLDPKHGNQPGPNPGKEGVRIDARAGGRCGAQSNLETLTMQTFHEKQLSRGSVDFYAASGPPLPGYLFRKRYHNNAAHDEYDCAQDGDLCETLGWYKINGGPPHKCATKACTIWINTP